MINKTQQQLHFCCWSSQLLQTHSLCTTTNTNTLKVEVEEESHRRAAVSLLFLSAAQTHDLSLTHHKWKTISKGTIWGVCEAMCVCGQVDFSLCWCSSFSNLHSVQNQTQRKTSSFTSDITAPPRPNQNRMLLLYSHWLMLSDINITASY